MNAAQRNAAKALPQVLDAFTVFPEDDNSTLVVIQATPYICLRNRRIYLNFWQGAWYYSSIALQDIQMRQLENIIDAGADGMVQSEILHAAYLYPREGEQNEELFDTSKGLLAVYLDLKEWDEFIDNKRKCTDLHKTYIILRHQEVNQPVQDLDIWEFTDHKETLWATLKTLREDKIY